MSKLYEIGGQTIFPRFGTEGQIKGYFSYPIPEDGPLPENYDYSLRIPRTAEEFEAELKQKVVDK